MTDENQSLPLTDKTLKASNFHTVIRKMAAVDSGNRSIAFRAAVQQYAIFGHCDSFLISYALPEFPLRVHAEVVYHPNHYEDADGAEIWDIVCEYCSWDKFAVLAVLEEEESDEQLLAYSS